jgi:hypothetical protein
MLAVVEEVLLGVVLELAGPVVVAMAVKAQVVLPLQVLKPLLREELI